MKQYKPGDVIPKEELKRYKWGPIKKGDLVASTMGDWHTYGHTYRHGEVDRVVGILDSSDDPGIILLKGGDGWYYTADSFVKVSGVRRRSGKPKPKPKVNKKVGRKPVQLVKDASGLYALCDDNSIWWLPSDSAISSVALDFDAKWYQMPPVPTN